MKELTLFQNHKKFLDYDKNENVVGVEILNFTERKLNLNDLIQMNNEELIPRLAHKVELQQLVVLQY